MNSKYVEQRCGKHEIRKTGNAVALQVGENNMSTETWLPCVTDADIILCSCDLFFLCPPNGIVQVIIFLYCGFFSYLLLFFLAYSQPSHIGVANLGCRSETCCTRLTEKYRTQKIAKNSPSASALHNSVRPYLRN